MSASGLWAVGWWAGEWGLGSRLSTLVPIWICLYSVLVSSSDLSSLISHLCGDCGQRCAIPLRFFGMTWPIRAKFEITAALPHQSALISHQSSVISHHSSLMPHPVVASCLMVMGDGRWAMGDGRWAMAVADWRWPMRTVQCPHSTVHG